MCDLQQSPDKDKETTSDVPAGDQSSQSGSEHPATSKPIQSRFKPGARPPPRVIGSTLSQPLFGVSNASVFWLVDKSYCVCSKQRFGVVMVARARTQLKLVPLLQCRPQWVHQVLVYQNQQLGKILQLVVRFCEGLNRM